MRRTGETEAAGAGDGSLTLVALDTTQRDPKHPEVIMGGSLMDHLSSASNCEKRWARLSLDVT